MMDNLARTTTDERAFSNTQPFPNFTKQYADPKERWEIVVQNALVKLVEMPNGWDSYGAPAVKRDAGHFALEILHKVMGPRSPVPQVVPSSVGGVQLEWHEKDIDLEIHVAGPYECEVWYHDHRDEEEPLSVDISSDFSILEAPIHALTNR